MKQTDLSRRAFLLGLGAVSSAALLSACNTNAPVNSGPTPSQPEREPAASPDASSEGTREPILTADEFPMTDGSTACIPLIAQIMADTTGMDLETAQSCVSTNTTAWAWRNLSLYGGNEGDSTKLIIAYEAPESVKEEMAAEGGPLDQKAIGQTLFQKLLIQGGELMDAPTELAPTEMGGLVDSIAEYNNTANAIGFSVYYYIDQMYSKPGLRLLAVDGVTPSNETIADQSYPLCNEFYAAVRQDSAEGTPERKVYDWLSTDAGRACIEKSGYVAVQD